MLNLDTHILIYALQGELKSNEVELLAQDQWSISDIVPWEVAKLTSMTGRLCAP